jgi:hypothetical protein
MESVKNVTAQTTDPARFECTSVRPDPDGDDDRSDAPDDNDGDVPEEAGYGYGV